MQTGQIQFNGPNNWDVLNTQEEAARKHRLNNELDTVEKNHEKLDKLLECTNQFCFSIRTHMPFDLFPDDLIVDMNKVTFIDKTLMSKDTISIPIRDLNKVEVTNDLLFASIELVNGSQTTFINVTWLKKDEARQAQAIIQGLMIASRNELRIEDFTPDEIMEKMQSLGTPVV